MLSKRTHPMIGRLSELLVPSNRAGFLDVSTSPRTPLDYRIQSPRGLKNYDLGGVGLGIVAALEKSSSDAGGREVLAKYGICSPNMSRSDPIPLNSGKRCDCRFKQTEMESLEDYTYVTSYGPDKSLTKVYYDDGQKGHDRIGVFSTAKEPPARFVDEAALYGSSDFLSSCHLCRKGLHGKDIYMYRYNSSLCFFLLILKFWLYHNYQAKIWLRNDGFFQFLDLE